MLGITNPSNIKEPNVQVIGYEKIIHHPYFSISSIQDDIMLIKLNRVAHLNNYVKLVKLPNQPVRVDTMCMVTTWGYNICDVGKSATCVMSAEFNGILLELVMLLNALVSVSAILLMKLFPGLHIHPFQTLPFPCPLLKESFKPFPCVSFFHLCFHA